MLHIIGHMLFGLVVGLIAKLVFPGKGPGGIIVTMLLGVAGAWLGGYIGHAMRWYPKGHPAGFLMAIAGALILLFVYHMIFREKPRAAVPRLHTVIVAVASPTFPGGLRQTPLRFGGHWNRA